MVLKSLSPTLFINSPLSASNTAFAAVFRPTLRISPRALFDQLRSSINVDLGRISDVEVDHWCVGGTSPYVCERGRVRGRGQFVISDIVEELMRTLDVGVCSCTAHVMFLSYPMNSKHLLNGSLNLSLTLRRTLLRTE